MAKKIVIICSLLIISSLGRAQDQTPTTVFYYNLMVDQAFQADLRDIDEFAEDLNSFLQGKNPLSEGIIDETYAKLATQIDDATKFRLLPIETLQKTDGRSIFYTARGYPMGNKKLAITHRTSEYYTSIQVEVFMSSGSVSSASSGLGSRQSEMKKIRPRVRIAMKVFDEEGNRVGRYNATAETKEQVVIQTRTIANWFKIGDDRRLEDEENQQLLANLIDEAIAKLINDISVSEGMTQSSVRQQPDAGYP